MSPTLNFRPHERFWFDDGNIILVARDVGFKIYRGLLAINSTVFSDMLASSKEPQYSFDQVSALVRLAHKYGVQDVLDRSLRALQDARYTKDFSRYLELELDPTECDVKISPVHAIGAVNLAQLTQTSALLPLALYDCCQYGGDVLDGWRRDDGEVEYLSRED
ncbi:hypothetical protein DICSQDRAFT_63386 [Dichomitus squalens LYAD-421 SS1]|uniref:BTB domain-containing protein n=2 Tax=Dichomitus squalens TaxID=114155 RepID=A0A4V2K0D0_9APHY|nr:uncharacterized protein DICSQDRAFT_63386 [Dichomitus squalens LYAD-421 SS1]EJF60290.1 hypothetical protein DICSQDRAFT_63386 [Dichomitus squalens LYAD-421 SS1]TBU28383.1 hypothetical protein BD311DRAFT_778318 [Dichomitus squalens]